MTSKECKFCAYIYKFKSNYNKHLQEEHAKNIYTCSFCPKKVYFTERGIDIHQQKHLSSSCEKFAEIIQEDTRIVVQGYQLPQTLDELSEPEEQTNFPCSKCVEEFKTEKELSMHIEFLHDRNEDLFHCFSSPKKCRWCEDEFENREERNKHYKKEHIDELVSCEYCDKKWLKKGSSWERHQEEVQVFKTKTGYRYSCGEDEQEQEEEEDEEEKTPKKKKTKKKKKSKKTDEGVLDFDKEAMKKEILTIKAQVREIRAKKRKIISDLRKLMPTTDHPYFQEFVDEGVLGLEEQKKFWGYTKQ